MRHTPIFPFLVFLLLLPVASDDPANEGTDRRSSPSRGPNSRTLKDDGPPPLHPNNSTLGPPDVYLRVPDLSIGRLELDVDNLKADISLSASVANLVSVRAGVAVGVEKINISIAEVGARLDLVIRLASLVDIVNRTMHSLDLNPTLVNAINQVGDIGAGAVGAAGGILGTVVGKSRSGGDISVDDKGNIVEEKMGADGRVTREVVGDYRRSMTDTGREKKLDNGQVERTYAFEEAKALVDVVFNEKGEVVRTTVSREHA